VALMGVLYYDDMADVLRRAGLTVEEDPGWERRARSSGGFASAPLGIQWHHTASQTSPQNDVAWMAHNSDDAPIGNGLIARDGVVWLIAGGAANTAGKGGPVTMSRGVVPLDSGNSTTWAWEVANSGVGEPWPQVQIDAYFAASNAANERFGNKPSDVFTHAIGTGNGWTDRKVDPATAAAVQGPWKPRSVSGSGTWSLDDIRAECNRRAGDVPPLPGPNPTPPEDDMAEVVEIQVNGADAVFLGQFMKVGDTTGVLWAEWVNGNDPAQIERLLAYRGLGARVMKLNPDNFGGIGLLGPIPQESRYNWQRSDFGNVIT
jgi:hypothetical protein